MKTNSYKLGAILAGVVLLGQGCVFGGAKPTANDGGVFKSVNKGEAWAQKVAVPTVTGQKVYIAGVDIISLNVDPQDSKAIYAGTLQNGLFYTLDGGESWLQSKDAAVKAGRVASVAVDPKNKCIIYATVGNAVVKTTDCSRTFGKAIFTDERADARMNSVAVSYADSNVILAAGSAGDIRRSTDGGKSWTAVFRPKGDVARLLVSPANSTRVYAATRENGIFRSDDNGETWVEVTPDIKKFSNATFYTTGAIDQKNADHVIIATRYGLLETTDGGENWDSIPLVTAPGQTLIFALAINPQNAKEIYYGTQNVFYRTGNGGESWETKRVPTTRALTSLLVDPKDGNVVYLGVTFVEQEQ
ncbi:MAG: hypothetical protein HW383_4 [Candidatus Magasanikbacteria bacterium]|nr:hypothetical protein [Candidatus Magasanikbacteria bacterium]